MNDRAAVLKKKEEKEEIYSDFSHPIGTGRGGGQNVRKFFVVTEVEMQGLR